MKRKTIQSTLFLTYSLIIIIVFSVFVSFFYFSVSNLLKARSFEMIAKLSSSVSEKLDIEMQKLDYVSLGVLYSPTVKNRFMAFIGKQSIMTNASHNSSETDTDFVENMKGLNDVLFAIIGPNRPVQQIYLYGFNNTMFCTGADNRQQSFPVEKKPWFSEVISNKGQKYISLPMKDDELSKFVTKNNSPYFISLCRLFYDDYNTPQGIVEVKQHYDKIFDNIDLNIQNSLDEMQVYVYNSRGSIVYPLKEEATTIDSYYFRHPYSVPNGNEGLPTIINNPLSNERELINYHTSDYTGWTTVVAVSEAKLLSPVYSYTRVILIVAIIILLLALVFSFYAAKRITIPISKLNRAIKAFNLESPLAAEPIKTTSTLSELEDLGHAFYNMGTKLKKSHNELLLSHQHEMQARMLALQSQMNPHFLYNTLTTISVMAEESMEKQIVQLCNDLSVMLRYISSDDSPLVLMDTEIEYTKKYLSCMELRYGKKLSYLIDISTNMKNIKVPKLVIQPLVENALKYISNQKPPWSIEIYGRKTDTHWQVSVKDNGSGFDPEKLKSIWDTIEEIENNGMLPSLQLEGMGLLNIYMRLKLSYKDQMIFRIENKPTGGATVTIGGNLK